MCTIVVREDKMAKNDGFEPVDDRPVAVPVKLRAPIGEVDRLRDLMARLVVDMRDQNGVESFEESLDFEVDDDDDGPISQSETRYMQEEKLLTEAEEAHRVMLQRREAAKFKRRFKYGEDSGRRERTDGRGDEVPASGADSGGEKRAAAGGEGRAAGERSGGVSKGDEKAG